MMNPKHLLWSATACLPAVGIAQKATVPPNIVIINIDDMGYSDPSCYGGDYVPTPNIDRLAEDGLSLRQFSVSGRTYYRHVSDTVGYQYVSA